MKSNCEPPSPHCQCIGNIPADDIYIMHDMTCLCTYTHLVEGLCTGKIYVSYGVLIPFFPQVNPSIGLSG